MSGPDHDPYEERVEEIYNHQERMIEKMAECLSIYVEFKQKYPQEKCVEEMSVDSEYKIFFESNAKVKTEKNFPLGCLYSKK